MRTILFTNVRDEPHLAEWIRYHQSIGFTDIHIFDHLSRRPVADVVKCGGFANVVVKRINAPFPNKLGLNLAAARYARHYKYDWMMYLDGDEFLYLRDADSVDTFLAGYPHADQIGLNWLIFGSNGLDSQPQSILHAYTKSATKLCQEVKVFVRPHRVDTTRIYTPHCFILKPGGRSVGWDHGVLRGPCYKDGSGNADIHLPTAYVAHYMHQCYETYLHRKVRRSRDDLPGVGWGKAIPRDQFHLLNNDVENTVLLHKSEQFGVGDVK